MIYLSILYSVAAFVAICACIPQLAQLLKVRRSDEFELRTWLIWLMAQIVTLAYVTALGDTLMIVTNAAWVGFYSAMAYLIIHYRFIKKPLQEEPVNAKP